MHIVKALIGIFFLILLALLPLRLAQGLGRYIGRVIYKSKKSRIYDVSLKNIEQCFPTLAEDQRQRLLRASLEQTCISYTEMGFSWLWPTRWSLKKVVSVEGEELLQEAISRGKGVILISPHIGNWEVLNLYIGKSYPMTVLYKPPKSRFFDWLISRMRHRTGGDTAPGTAAGVKKIFKKLRRNGIVGILPDQEPVMGSGMFSPFFDRPAYTMTLLSQLAVKTQASVISCIAIRLDKGRGFQLRFEAVDPDISHPQLEVSVAALNRCVEKIAIANPEQYQWEYKRYRKEAPGLEKLY